MDPKDYRFYLHQIPELGRKEYKTCEYILDVASGFDCKIYRPTETAVVLFFDFGKKNTICLRADMDALPIFEENDVWYKSKNQGVMHACGHDGHMAMLLSACEWLNNNKDKANNNVVALFQPSEEDNAGANDILKSNILDDLKIKYIFGMHIWPKLLKGSLYSMPYGMLATSAEVNIDILGLSTHAANRSEAHDALLAGTTLINNYYSIISNFTKPHLVNFGKIDAGTARNVVAGACHIEATFRCYSDDDFDYLIDNLKKVINDVEVMYKVKVNLWINACYPSVINDLNLFNTLKNELGLSLISKPFLQAEDFGCYTRKYKSLFMLLGCGDEKLLHTSTFDFDTDILQIGVEAYKKIIKFNF